MDRMTVDEYLMTKESSGERGRGPVFAGREREIEHVEKRYEQILSASRGGPNPPQTISLFSGPPGMGKTSFLKEAEERLEIRIARDFGAAQLRPLVVDAATEDLETMERLTSRLAKTARDKNWIAAQGVKLTRAALRSIKAPGLDLGGAAEEIPEGGSALLESRPFIVLLVDEVQTSTRRNKEIYKLLHTGKTNPPIMPLFAGLSDSRTVLEDPERTGLTRIPPGNEFTLPVLTPEQVGRIVEETLDLVGMNTHDLDSWKTLAVGESRCFPQHLQIALYAMMERGRDAMSIEEGDEGPVREECAAGRDAYYRGRGELLEADGRDMANEVLRTLKGERYAKDAAAKAIEKFGCGGEDGWTPKALIEKMVHAGLLQHDPDDEYVEGIPSFTEWLGKECAARAARKRTAREAVEGNGGARGPKGAAAVRTRRPTGEDG